MEWAARSLEVDADEPFRGFNECLSVGYFGNAHMGVSEPSSQFIHILSKYSGMMMEKKS